MHRLQVARIQPCIRYADDLSLASVACRSQLVRMDDRRCDVVVQFIFRDRDDRDDVLRFDNLSNRVFVHRDDGDMRRDLWRLDLFYICFIRQPADGAQHVHLLVEANYGYLYGFRFSQGGSQLRSQLGLRMIRNHFFTKESRSISARCSSRASLAKKA